MPISAKTEPCWTLHNRDGEVVTTTWPAISDDPVHFGTRAQAQNDADERHGEREEPDGPFSPVQFLSVCYVAITDCGVLWDVEGEGFVAHFDSHDDMVKNLTGSGYTVQSDGAVACPAHFDCECPGRMLEV